MTQTELAQAQGNGQPRPMPSSRGESRFLGFFRYRLFRADGSEIGDAEYAVRVHAGETIWTLDGCELRVTALVPMDDERSPYTALLQVEAASSCYRSESQRSGAYRRGLGLLTFEGHVRRLRAALPSR